MNYLSRALEKKAESVVKIAPVKDEEEPLKVDVESLPPPPVKKKRQSESTKSIVKKVEVKNPAQKILNRKRIRKQDCRKSPAGGIVPEVENAPESDLKKPNLKSKWCRSCDGRHDPAVCPLRRPDVIFTDAVIDFSNGTANAKDMKNNSDGLDLSKSFAQLSLPSPPLGLEERESSHGLSVVLKESLAARSRFGPLQGEPIEERDVPEDFSMKDLWQVFIPDGKRRFLSTVNPEKSNWLRYLRPAPTRKKRNLAAIVIKSQDDEYKLYFVTTKKLEAGDELLYWMDDPDLMWTRKRAEKTSKAFKNHCYSLLSVSFLDCGGCNMRFPHPLYYRLHCNVFHDPHFSLTIRKFHCKICGLAVLGKENIVKHASSEHGGKGAYQCRFCKKFFLRLNYLEMHKTYGCAANPGRTRPVCGVCGKKFCQPQKLKIHMRRVHGGEYKFSYLIEQKAM